MYWLFCLNVSCTVHVFDSCLSQKKGLDPLKLEAQKVVRHEVGARNRTQVLWKRNQCAWLPGHLFRPDRKKAF